MVFVAIFIRFSAVQKFWKSVKIWQGYREFKGGNFFWDSVEMLAQWRAGQRDGHRHQIDDDFGGWVKTVVLFLAVSGPKFAKFWDDVGDHS